MPTQTGVDRLLENEEELARLADRSVGLVTNQTGVTADLTYNREALMDAGIDLTRLYCPEHGIWGVADAGEEVTDATDDLTGLPVHSLYGDYRTPPTEILDDVDVLVFDIQDVGTRCWTYTATMRNCMEAAAREGLPFVVLDRPNPMTGEFVHGRPVDPDYETFVGHRGLPMTYGLTIGEFARYANAEYDVGADLSVVELDGWHREEWFDETGLLWGPSSPALFYMEKALVYPGTVLLEGTNLESGDDRYIPTMMAAPWLDYESAVDRIHDTLAEQGLEGVRLRKEQYRAEADDAGEEDTVNRGFQIHVADREAFLPFETALVCLREIAALHPDEFEFTNVDHFDRLAGTDEFRELIEDGAPAGDLVDLAGEGTEAYRESRDPYLLY